MVSEAELNGWQETMHLLSNPANARRLLHSIRFGDAGKTGEHRRVYRILGKRSADQRMEFVPCRYHCGN